MGIKMKRNLWVDVKELEDEKEANRKRFLQYNEMVMFLFIMYGPGNTAGNPHLIHGNETPLNSILRIIEYYEQQIKELKKEKGE